MCTVSGSESIVNPAIAIGSKFFGKSFVAFFFFLVETKVFEHQHFTGLQRFGHCLNFGANTIGSKFYFATQQFAEVTDQMFHRIFVVRTSFWASKMRHNDWRTTFGNYFVDGLYSRTNTGIIGNHKIFVERHVEINTDKCFFTSEFVCFNCLHVGIFLSLINPVQI